MDKSKNNNENQLSLMSNIVARKPFVLTSLNIAKDREREMAVFSHAKKLSEYVFVITEKSPKKYRWSIVSKLQNTSVEIIEELYHANFKIDNDRKIFQSNARVKLCLLEHFAEVAKNMQAINNHQMQVLAGLIEDVSKLLTGWIKSDKHLAKK